MSKCTVQASQISFLRRSSESKIILKFVTLPYLQLEIVSFAIGRMWLILFLFSLSFRFALCETKKCCLFVYFNLHVCLCENKLFDISPKYLDVVTVEECMSNVIRLLALQTLVCFPQSHLFKQNIGRVNIMDELKMQQSKS